MISPDTFVLKNGGCINGFEFDVFESDGSNLAEPETCPSCGRFVDLLTLTEPISGNLVAEKSLYDLSAHLGGEIVFSAKARKEFNKHQVTGIKNVRKLGILEVEGPFQIHELDEYFLAQVSYGARIDRIRSGFRTTSAQLCDICGYSGIIEGVDRIALEQGSWSGADFFRVRELSGVVLMSARLVQICTDADLKVRCMLPSHSFSLSFEPDW